MTMIETMIAMAISSVLILGTISVYSGARANYRTTENLARLQENLRFATDTLDQDIRLAGFWGRTNEGAAIVENPAIQVMCSDDDVTAWALQPEVGIAANDDTFTLPCNGMNPRENSDVLVVRHASTNQNTVVTPDRVQILASNTGGQFFADGIAPADIIPEQNQVYDVAVNAYYVSNESKYDDTLPSLRRRSLVGTTMQDQEIIAGVENLQVQFGIDRNEDGQADGYVDGDNPAITPENVVSVRLWLLVRGDTNEAGQGYVDDNVYSTPDASGLEIMPDAGDAYPRNYRRYAFTKTIMLKNRLRPML